MKAKLIKGKNGHYFLETQPYTLSSLQRHTITANTFDKPKGHILQLSLKNCQAIERGYDLYELAKNIKTEDGFEHKQSFIAGFQKALEFMDDKKFSEKDLLKSLHKLADSFIKGYPYHQDLDFQEGNQIIQSLQQTEWDVEIIEECLDKDCDGLNRKGECITTGKPKLDSEGCLILRLL
jgi:hypothetical protein